MHGPSPYQLALLLLIKGSYCQARGEEEDGNDVVPLDEISLHKLAAFLSAEVIQQLSPSVDSSGFVELSV